MRKKIMMTLLGVLSACSMAFADDQNYSGTVVTASGEPIMGATVTVTGTTVSTITDMDGKFNLVVPDGYSTVTITYSGMKKQVVTVQREPIMLYASAEAAEAAKTKVQVIKPIKNNTSYKKNAFNLELNIGQPAGALSDMIGGDPYILELDLGYKHNFSQYIGWHVLDASVSGIAGNWHYENDVYDTSYDGALIAATTGIILRTPSWKKISLFASFNIGAGYDVDSGDCGTMYKARVGVNFGKWLYVAYKYEYFDSSIDYDSWRWEEDNDKPQFHMFTLGFNF